MKKIGILLLTVFLIISLTACKSDDYQEAMELYINREYDAALVIFTELGNYEDSINMVTKCRYAQACSLLQNGKYEDARIIFEELGNYEDSAENVKECYYQQAVLLITCKDYEAAEKIFAMLGDYKDSAEYARDTGWYLFLNYVSEHGEVTPGNLLYNHTGVITVESGCLCAEIENSMFSASVVVDHSNPKAELYADFYSKMGSSIHREQGYTQWDIGRYQNGDLIFWDEYDYYDNGKQINGKPKYTLSPELLPGESGANLITALTDCIRKGLEESGLDVTMADLGFARYGK